MRRLLLALLALFWADLAVASTETNYSGVTSMTFQNGVLPTTAYTGISDARIKSVAADIDRNFGANLYLKIGGASATGSAQSSVVMSADLSALPDSAVVLRARLWLYQVSRVIAANSPFISLYRLYKPFTVGTGDSTSSATGANGVTWNYRTSGQAWVGVGASTRGSGSVFDYSWSSMQALAATDTTVGTTAFAGSDTTDGSAGAGDSPGAPVASRYPKGGTGTGNQYYKQTGWVSFDITTLVRQAVNGAMRLQYPSTSIGFVMIGDEAAAGATGLMIYPSSDYTTDAATGKAGKVYRPKIIVEYFDPTSSSSSGGRRIIGNGSSGLH